LIVVGAVFEMLSNVAVPKFFAEFSIKTPLVKLAALPLWA